MKAALKFDTVTARQVTIETMVDIASWCGGAIKGTKLPPADRVIELVSYGEEHQAKVGDWIIRIAHDRSVRRHPYHYLIAENSTFHDIFKEVK